MEKSITNICTGFISLSVLIHLLTVSGCQHSELPGQFTEGFVQSTDGIELYYRIMGAGPDTLIMLHGGPGLNFDYLAPDLEPLEELFTLIYYDQRGAGRSTLLRNPDLLSVDAHVADLEAVRNHFGLNKISLFGHSWGAMLAAFYAVDHSINLNKMVFASPGPPRFEPYFPKLRPNLMAWMDSTIHEETVRLMAATQDTTISARESCQNLWEVFIRGYFSDPDNLELIRSMRGDFCTMEDEVIRNTPVVSTHTMETISDYDLRESFPDIEIPVLIITGTDDFFPVQAMREWEAAFPDSRLVLLENAAHYPQIERPKKFFRFVTGFLFQ
ncbi:MAG: alpha/beta fold hydrolase [Balneolaceae bacterium]|nr:MAG: alpha/beta fold hydrolase [Balneolaceae bacterium]